MKNLAIIDGDFICYIFKTITKDKTTGEEIIKSRQELQSSIDSFIFKILKELNSNCYLGYLTSSTNFRYEIDKTYKANRPSKPDDHYWIKDYLKEHWKFKVIENYEADDSLYSVYRYIKVIYPELNPTRVSPDKDVYMLEGRAYNPMKNIHLEVTKEQADYFFCKSLILGDDGLKGLKGKGEKYASKVLNEKFTLEQNLTIVFNEYLKYYRDSEQAVNEFYKVYKCLKLVDKEENINKEDINVINTFVYE